MLEEVPRLVGIKQFNADGRKGKVTDALCDYFAFACLRKRKTSVWAVILVCRWGQQEVWFRFM